MINLDQHQHLKKQKQIEINWPTMARRSGRRNTNPVADGRPIFIRRPPAHCRHRLHVVPTSTLHWLEIGTTSCKCSFRRWHTLYRRRKDAGTIYMKINCQPWAKVGTTLACVWGTHEYMHVHTRKYTLYMRTGTYA